MKINLFQNKKKPEKQKNIKMSKKKKYIVSIITIMVIILFAIGIFFFYIKSKEDGNSYQQRNMPEITMDGVTASGTTSIGIVDENFEPDYIETELEIEEVYLSSGDEVEAGTAILKISDESIEKARKELELAATEAELAYRAGVITCEQSKITAKYDYDSSVLSGKQAKEVYDETVASLQAKITEIEESIAESQEDLAEYQDAIANDTYEDEYEVTAKYEKYQEDLKVLQTMVAENELDWSSITGVNADGSTASNGQSTGGAQAGQNSQGGQSGNNAALSTAKSLYSEVNEDEQNWETAKEDYENAVEEANFGIKKLPITIENLESDLTQAKSGYQTGCISAKADYQISLASADMAQDDYDTAVEKAEEELETLLDEKEDTAENLQEFEDLIGDGKLYTSSKGNILMVAVKEGNTLTGDDRILAYSNPDEITVSAYVDQADVAKLTVGDTANVSIDDYGNYTGIITTIDPVSSSTSRTSITYTVTVTLDGDVSDLTSNLTATVIFGIGGTKE